MTLIESVIREFGNSLRMPDIQPNENGSVCLRFSGSGRMFIEPDRDSVLVYFVHTILPYEIERLEIALRKIHYTNYIPFDLQVGYRPADLQVIYGTHIDVRDFTPLNLEDVLNTFLKVTDQVIYSSLQS